MDLLPLINSAPVGATVAAVGLRAWDHFFPKKVAKHDELVDLNTAQASLSNSLTEALNVMTGELERLRGDMDREREDCARQMTKYQSRVDELLREVDRLRIRVIEAEQEAREARRVQPVAKDGSNG